MIPLSAIERAVLYRVQGHTWGQTVVQLHLDGHEKYPETDLREATETAFPNLKQLKI